MPIYEYYCPDCARTVELFQRRVRTKDDPLPGCPECREGELQTRFSRFRSKTELSFPGFDTLDDVDADDPESVAAWRKSAGAAPELPADLA
ncbi:MAG: zinc ribbon domain-containing protein [Chloroflexi bacterium]|nr:zinc ribbon domain-containing protein [Chloroflexota bacterium]